MGAGLAGLRLADLLFANGQDFLTLEGRDRPGGRVLSQSIADTPYDLGPAWFWREQPLINDLIADLGLKPFDQYATGNLIFEDAQGAVRRDLAFSTMAGSQRLVGGLGTLTSALQARLPKDRLLLKHVVTSLTQAAAGIQASVETPTGVVTVIAQRVVLAVPPRVIAECIQMTPALSDTALQTMAAVPTWMAGHAKVVAVYETPFWRETGFSGDAISHRGPLVEIHDASADGEVAGALFGFVGVLADMRHQSGFDLKALAVEHLTRLFGPAAANPSDVLIQDWATEPLTATKADSDSPPQHPVYGLPPALNGLWDGAVLLGSTEVATMHGGFLEGALESADAVFQRLIA